MINVVSQALTRQIYDASYVLGTCKDALMDLVKKIQEVIKNVWESICWCCYSKAGSPSPLTLSEEMVATGEHIRAMNRAVANLQAQAERVRVAEDRVVFGELAVGPHDDFEGGREPVAPLPPIIEDEQAIQGAEEERDLGQMEDDHVIDRAEEERDLDQMEDEQAIHGAEEQHAVVVAEEDRLDGADLPALFPYAPELPQGMQPQNEGVIDVLDFVPVPAAQQDDGGAAGIGLIGEEVVGEETFDQMIENAVTTQNSQNIDFVRIEGYNLANKRSLIPKLTEKTMQNGKTSYFLLRKNKAESFLCVRITPPRQLGQEFELYWFGKNMGTQDDIRYVAHEVIGLRE